MTRLLTQFLVTLFALGCLAKPACAQTFAVSSVDNVALGTVVAGAVGETVLRIDPATGSVTKVSGSGVRQTTLGARSLVTISCTIGANCNVSKARITISTSGSPSGRALALRNFTVSTAGASATVDTQPGTGSSITFTVQPIGLNQSKTLWVGFDLPIQGDDSGVLANTAISPFVVTVARLTGTGANSLSQTADASVVRSLAITKSADLGFGRIALPSSGSGLVSLNPVTGLRTVTGTGAAALATPAPTAAQFTIAGEGGQSVSVTVPATFSMTGPNGAITVTTSANVSGAQVLSGTLGTAGTLAVRVGGSYPFAATTPKGAYSGSLTVMVQYN